MKYSYLSGAAGTPVRYSLDAYKDKTRLIITAFVSCLAVFAVVASQVVDVKTTPVAQALTNPQQTQQTAVQPTATDASATTEPSADEKVTVTNNPKSIDLSSWFLSHKGTYGLSIYDKDGNSLAEANASDQFYMASIYKFYVVYLGYQNIDKGIWKADDANYWTDWSRAKCMDEAVRSSHSPCAEKLMAELGKSNIQARLDDYGLENTSFKTFTTSSGDVANVLNRLQKGIDLTPESRQKMMDSMQGQIYRDGMPKGFSDWTVYDKVGFKEQDEYHDVGIVMSSKGDPYIVSILTKNAGTANIESLAREIKAGIEK